MNYIDLTHKFGRKMAVFPGDSEPKIKQIAFIESEGYCNFQINSEMHIGTHIESPMHMIKNGKKISEYSVDHFFGRGHLIDARNLGGQKIESHLLDRKNISRGDILLILTGYSTNYGTRQYFESFPELSNNFTEMIIKIGVKIIGLDSPSPDSTPYLVHKMLFAKDILIIENLTNLDKLLAYEEFEIIALPAKFDTDAAPARVVAKII